jgi:hypothetical protein
MNRRTNPKLDEALDLKQEERAAKVALVVMRGSYVLCVLGFVLLIIGLLIPSSHDVVKPILTELAATILPASILSIFFDSFVKRLLVQEFSTEVRKLVQDGRECKHIKDSGISDFIEEPERETIYPMFARAKREIIICKTWIPEREIDVIKSAIKAALLENPDVHIRILCLDPDSPFVLQRYRDSREQSKNLKESNRPQEPIRAEKGREMIKDSLEKMIEFSRDEADPDSRKKIYQQLEIKIYRNIPALSLYASEEKALLGWYWMEKESFGGPVLEVEGEKLPLARATRANFERMWSQASDYAREIQDDYVWKEKAPSYPESILDRLGVPRSPEELKQILETWPELRRYGETIRKFVDQEGYCVVKNFPFPKSKSDLMVRKNLFLLLVCACGTPSDHKEGVGEPEYICEVKPQRDLQRKVPTYSEHDHEAPLHTDSIYHKMPEKFVGFLMEEKSEVGGRNILLKVSSIFNEMGSTSEGKRWLEYLKTHRLPSVTPSRYSNNLGSDPKVEDVLIIDENEETIKFRADTISKGINQRKGQHQRVDPKVSDALKFLCTLMYQNPDRRGINLANGEILFVNNEKVLHARTSFEGFTRLLLRIRFN